MSNKANPRKNAPPPAFDAERFKSDMRQVFLLNEASAAKAYKLSFAGGPKSGYSFGSVQLDTANNEIALSAFNDIIDGHAKANPGAIEPGALERIKAAAAKKGTSPVIRKNKTFINAALSSEAGRQKIDEASEKHLDWLAGEVTRTINAIPEGSPGYDFSRTRQGQTALGNWINQTGASTTSIPYMKGEDTTLNGKTIKLDKPMDIEVWRAYQKATKYGQENKTNDIDRRLNNIIKTIPNDQKKGEAETPERTAASLAFQQRLEEPHENAAWQTAVKDPASWTKEEAQQVMADYAGRPSSDPMKAFLQDLTTEHFRHVYGDGPMEPDATGKLFGREINPPPESPQPLVRQDEGVGKFGGQMAELIDREGGTQAVKALQGGLNMAAGDAVFPRLMEDGQYGPYTDFALRRTLEHKGPGAAEEALALGRWREMAPKAGQDPETLGSAVGQIFGPLYGQDGEGLRSAATAFQIGLNDLGAKSLGPSWEALKQDGDIGPKTTTAFNSLLEIAGPDALAKQIGESARFF